MTASIGCSGTMENTTMLFTYIVVQMANGNVFASGSVAGPGLQASDARLYGPDHVGFTAAPVYMLQDVVGTANYGVWKLSLDRATLVTLIEYTDNEASGGKLTWTMTPDKCVKATF